MARNVPCCVGWLAVSHGGADVRGHLEGISTITMHVTMLRQWHVPLQAADRSVPVAMWKKRNVAARVRREYKTADEVLSEAGEAAPAARQQTTTVLDMRGPQARVVTNLEHLNVQDVRTLTLDLQPRCIAFATCCLCRGCHPMFAFGQTHAFLIGPGSKCKCVSGSCTGWETACAAGTSLHCRHARQSNIGLSTLLAVMQRAATHASLLHPCFHRACVKHPHDVSAACIMR